LTKHFFTAQGKKNCLEGVEKTRGGKKFLGGTQNSLIAKRAEGAENKGKIPRKAWEPLEKKKKEQENREGGGGTGVPGKEKPPKRRGTGLCKGRT